MSQEPLVTEDLIARQTPEAQAIIRLLMAKIDLLMAKINELEARLNKTPRNSSLPPSTEHPHAKPAPQRGKSGKKPGGQPGHPKHERALIPVEQCQSVIPLKPDACRRCAEPLTGNDPQPLRHQDASGAGR
jgi:transposase